MKRLLLLLILLLLSGCTVNYNIKINKDLTLEENLKVLENANYFDREGNLSEGVKLNVDAGMNELREKVYYEYEYAEDNNEYGAKIKYTYSSLESFLENSKTFQHAYDEIEIIKENNIITIKNKTPFKINNFVLLPSAGYEDIVIPKDCYISITSYYKVIDNNADKVDTNSNTYYWRINEQTTEKDLLLVFDTNSKFISIKTILGDINYTFIIIIGIILIGLVAFYIIKNKYNKNNKI